MADLTTGRIPKAIGATQVGDSLITDNGAGGISIAGPLVLAGATSGGVTLRTPAAAGASVITFPVGTTDFSATGGAGRVLKQVAAGAPITVAAVTPADMGSLGAGVATWLGTPNSANLAATVTDETGTGALVFANTPTLVTPAIGVANATTLMVGGITTPMMIGGTNNQGMQLASTLGTARLVLVRAGADTNSPAMYFGKSRGTLTTAGAVLQNDPLGDFRWHGDDGSTAGAIATDAASHRVEVDGAVSTGIVPGRFVWLTQGLAGGSVVERLRLSAGGSLGLNVAGDPQAMLHVGRTAATARIYNSYTDASNGEWAYLGSWAVAANVATYGSAMNGTGVARNVSLVRGGVEAINLGAGVIKITSPCFALSADGTLGANPLELFRIGGSFSLTNLNSNGIIRFGLTTTITDTTSTGTITTANFSTFAAPTIAASNVVTFTRLATLRIAAAPIAGTNVTITNGYALEVTTGESLFLGGIVVGTSTLLRSSVALSNAAAAAAGTLTNAPVAGNPSKWISIDDAGTIRRIPAW